MIRELRDEDVPAAVRLFNTVYPMGLNSEAGYRHRLATEPARARRRTWVADEDGIVGWSAGALVAHSDRDDVGWLMAGVLPEARGRGLGSALFELAERHLLDLGARRLLSGSTDDAASRRFLSTRGFTHTHTTRLSRVDPREIDRGELVGLAAEKEREGFTLVPFAAFRERPELIHAVDLEASLDVPVDEPIARLPLNEWIEENWQHPLLAHEGSFAVVLDDSPVAMAGLRVNVDDGRAFNDFTGTLREFRGRGLARLAKLASLVWAADHGITQIATENDETNAPMLAVNTRLGYKPFAAELSWLREKQ